MTTPILDHVPDFVVTHHVVDTSTCTTFINKYQHWAFRASETYSGVVPERCSEEVAIPDDDPFVQKILHSVNAVNTSHYRFNVTGLDGPARLLRYTAPDSGFVWHTDRSNGIPVRKLSFSLQLSAPGDYTGGELQLNDGPIYNMPTDLGTLIVFPSYTLHRVSQLLSGTRYALVGWLTGLPFV